MSSRQIEHSTVAGILRVSIFFFFCRFARFKTSDSGLGWVIVKLNSAGLEKASVWKKAKVDGEMGQEARDDRK